MAGCSALLASLFSKLGACAKISQETSFREGTNVGAAQDLVTALHAGGTGLVLEMLHREKLQV